MYTLNFHDVNIWLELLWSRRVQSEQAREWFERSVDEQFFFCRFTQITALWHITTKETIGMDTKNMAVA